MSEPENHNSLIEEKKNEIIIHNQNFQLKNYKKEEEEISMIKSNRKSKSLTSSMQNILKISKKNESRKKMMFMYGKSYRSSFSKRSGGRFIRELSIIEDYEFEKLKNFNYYFKHNNFEEIIFTLNGKINENNKLKKKEVRRKSATFLKFKFTSIVYRIMENLKIMKSFKQIKNSFKNSLKNNGKLQIKDFLSKKYYSMIEKYEIFSRRKTKIETI